MSLKNSIVSVYVAGKKKEHFVVNLPNIRNLQGFLKGCWDLSVYDDCFPRRNRLADVDGSIELNGFTLHVEYKESKWSMNQGQVIKAIRQAKYSNITTIFVFGKTNQPTSYLLFTPKDLQPDYIECDQESLNAVFKRWSNFTEKNNLVKSNTAEWQLANKYFTKGD